MYHLVKIQNIQISTWTKNNKITRCDTVNFDFVFKKKKKDNENKPKKSYLMEINDYTMWILYFYQIAVDESQNKHFLYRSRFFR